MDILDIQLIDAAKNNNAQLAETVIQKGANLDCRINDWTPLMIAAGRGHREVVLVLIKNGANINLTESQNRWSPLMIASGRGRSMIVQDLLNSNANIDQVDILGCNSLMIAINKGEYDCAKILIHSGIDISVSDNLKKWTALMMASVTGREDIINLLLEKGSDPSTEAIDGSTALSIAKEFRQNNAKNILLRYGAKDRNKKVSNFYADSTLQKYTFKNILKYSFVACVIFSLYVYFLNLAVIYSEWRMYIGVGIGSAIFVSIISGSNLDPFITTFRIAAIVVSPILAYLLHITYISALLFSLFDYMLSNAIGKIVLALLFMVGGFISFMIPLVLLIINSLWHDDYNILKFIITPSAIGTLIFVGRELLLLDRKTDLK